MDSVPTSNWQSSLFLSFFASFSLLLTPSDVFVRYPRSTSPAPCSLILIRVQISGLTWEVTLGVVADQDETWYTNRD